MHNANATSRRRAASLLALLVLPGAVHGCSKPTAPAPPPGGGQSLVLDFAQFQSTVSPVLTAKGCDAIGDCHGGGIRGTLQLSPAGAKNAQYDFNQVVLQVSPTRRDSSRILTEPLALAAGGTPHPVKVFADTTDSGFVAMRTWVRAGVLR